MTAGQSALGQVQNRESSWIKLIYWGLIVMSIGGVIYTLHATGAFIWLRAIARLVPKRTRDRARLDAKAVVSGEVNETHQRAITASRASDRLYDREFRRQKQQTLRKKG